MLNEAEKMMISQKIVNCQDFLVDDFVSAIGTHDDSVEEILDFLLQHTLRRMKDAKNLTQKLKKHLQVIRSFLNYYVSEKKEISVEERELVEALIQHILENYPDNDMRALAYAWQEQLGLLRNKKRIQKETEITNTSDFEKQNQALQKALKQRERELEKLRNTIKKSEDTIKAKELELENQNHTVQELEKQLTSVNEELQQMSFIYQLECEKSSKLFGRLEAAKKRVEQYRISDKSSIENSNIKKIQTENNALRSELEWHKKMLQVYEQYENANSQKLKNQEDKEKKVISLLFMVLKKGATLEEIRIFLAKNGYTTPVNKIYEYIKIMEQELGVQLNKKLKLQYPVIYKIDTDYIHDEQFFIKLPSNKVFEYIFTSDFHVLELTKREKFAFDSLNDYAALKNIDWIFIAGDIFGFKKAEITPYFILKCIEKSALALARNSQVQYGIMGGNHDEDAKLFGIDPIAQLTDYSENFHHLGYDHAQIILGNNHNIIGLHHFHRRLLEEQNKTGFNTFLLQKAINQYYQEHGQNRNQIFLDACGHFHVSLLDKSHGICCIPSLLRDRMKNGAWHVKVYFNKQNRIDHMLFIPLILEKKLRPQGELVYTRRQKANKAINK